MTALCDVTLSVAAGEFTVVLGPSGSGKTTILNMIGALDVPTSGRVVIDGHDITGASRRELFAYRRSIVAFVFQTFNLFPGLTARENVEFGIDVARGKPIVAPRRRFCATSAWATGSITFPISCPVGNSNGSRSRALWQRVVDSSSPTSRPASSTTAPVCRSSASCAIRLQRARA